MSESNSNQEGELNPLIQTKFFSAVEKLGGRSAISGPSQIFKGEGGYLFSQSQKDAITYTYHNYWGRQPIDHYCKKLKSLGVTPDINTKRELTWFLRQQQAKAEESDDESMEDLDETFEHLDLNSSGTSENYVSLHQNASH